MQHVLLIHLTVPKHCTQYSLLRAYAATGEHKSVGCLQAVGNVPSNKHGPLFLTQNISLINLRLSHLSHKQHNRSCQPTPAHTQTAWQHCQGNNTSNRTLLESKAPWRILWQCRAPLSRVLCCLRILKTDCMHWVLSNLGAHPATTLPNSYAL
jgi:hypothetical protein